MDTSALSEFTLKHIEKLKGTNIKVVPEKVDTIESLPSGCVVNGRNYNFVVDCSGYEPLLYKDEYIDSEIPTVDSAVIYRRKTPGKWNHTVHFAHENGWMFGIPLRDRQTWGYTFSSKFCFCKYVRNMRCSCFSNSKDGSIWIIDPINLKKVKI